MASMYLLIPLSLMLFVVGIWAVRYAVRSNQFEDLDNESQRIILDDRQERRQSLSSKQPGSDPASTSDSKLVKHSQTSSNSQPDSIESNGDGE